jgi:hypothetical protein
MALPVCARRAFSSIAGLVEHDARGGAETADCAEPFTPDVAFGFLVSSLSGGAREESKRAERFTDEWAAG